MNRRWCEREIMYVCMTKKGIMLVSKMVSSPLLYHSCFMN